MDDGRRPLATSVSWGDATMGRGGWSDTCIRLSHRDAALVGRCMLAPPAPHLLARASDDVVRSYSGLRGHGRAVMVVGTAFFIKDLLVPFIVPCDLRFVSPAESFPSSGMQSATTTCFD